MGPLEAPAAEAERSALIAALVRGVIALRRAADADDRPIRLLFRSEEMGPSSARVVFLDYGISVGLPPSGRSSRSCSARLR